MKIQFFIGCGALGIVLLTCGCVSSGQTYRARSAYNQRSYSGYQPTYRKSSPQVPATQSHPQVVTQPTVLFTDPGATGSDFRQEYSQTVQRERERSINEYLRTCGMWGSTVQDTRDKMKISIASADRQLAQLRNKIIVAGGTPATNSSYRAAKEARDNLAAKLEALDNRIMNAIVSKATGDVARRLIWEEEDKVDANAAMDNLQRAEER